MSIAQKKAREARKHAAREIVADNKHLNDFPNADLLLLVSAVRQIATGATAEPIGRDVFSNALAYYRNDATSQEKDRLDKFFEDVIKSDLVDTSPFKGPAKELGKTR